LGGGWLIANDAKIKEIRHNYVKKLGIIELRNVLGKGRLIPNSLNIPINATQKNCCKNQSPWKEYHYKHWNLNSQKCKQKYHMWFISVDSTSYAHTHKSKIGQCDVKMQLLLECRTLSWKLEHPSKNPILEGSCLCNSFVPFNYLFSKSKCGLWNLWKGNEIWMFCVLNELCKKSI
jgi:hypothetical protein